MCQYFSAPPIRAKNHSHIFRKQLTAVLSLFSSHLIPYSTCCIDTNKAQSVYCLIKMSSAAIDRSTKEDLLNRPLSTKREPQEGRRERSRSRDREPLNPHRHNRRYDNRRDPSRNGDHGRNPRNDEIVKSEPKPKAPANPQSRI